MVTVGDIPAVSRRHEKKQKGMSVSKISRRDLLKMLPAVPLMKMSWPHLVRAARDQAQTSGQPNILFLVFDTLSARHVGLHGYQRETTPNFARFAEKATVFHQHTAAGNFTTPATSTMLTGTYPWTHRAFHLHGLVRPDIAQDNIFSLLPPEYHRVGYSHNLLVMSLLHQMRGNLDQFMHTRELCLSDNQLADRLFINDYTAATWGEQSALQQGGTAPGTLFLSLLNRLNRSLDKRRLEGELGALYPRGVPNLHNLFFLLEDAIDWMGSEIQGLPKPFMGYFHLLPPHEPYTPHKDFIDIFRDGMQFEEKPRLFGAQNMSQQELNRQRRLYDEFLANTDAEFGRLMDMLEAQGLMEDTYIVVTSDHGELFERGIRGHVTLTLYDPLTHVPLLIHGPGQTTRQDVFTRTSGADFLPTFLQWTGQPVPAHVEGQVMPPYAEGGAGDGRDIYAMEAKSNPKFGPLQKVTVTLHRDEFKIVGYFGYNVEDQFELYNLQEDPEELVDLYPQGGSIARDLAEAARAKIAAENEKFTLS
jgi:arylsulfatase A-like enzyme